MTRGLGRAVWRLAGAAAVGWSAAALAQAPAAAETVSCGPGAGKSVRQVAQAEVRMAWQAEPRVIPLNRAFELQLALCDASARLLRVDADMPAHRHGMNYRTSLTSTGSGVYRAQGLVFHMPGRWRLLFDIEQGGKQVRLTDFVDLK